MPPETTRWTVRPGEECMRAVRSFWWRGARNRGKWIQPDLRVSRTGFPDPPDVCGGVARAVRARSQLARAQQTHQASFLLL
eukprot:scaffold379_cov235-Pinguiococcus_pyrenoidosus.AAC.4